MLGVPEKTPLAVDVQLAESVVTPALMDTGSCITIITPEISGKSRQAVTASVDCGTLRIGQKMICEWFLVAPLRHALADLLASRVADRWCGKTILLAAL